MKVKEILELTKSMNVAAIAKQIEGTSEKPLRAALKEIGCEHQSGTKGWYYTGDNPAILEQSIFDFLKPTEQKRKRTSNNTNKGKSKGNIVNASINDNNNDTKDDIPIDSNNNSNSNMKAEIKALLTSPPARKPAKVYKGIYFDSDIASILDSVQHGNKSELVNKIIRQYLVDNELLK